MNITLRILFLKDPSAIDNSDYYKSDSSVIIKTIISPSELIYSVKNFSPDIILASPTSIINPDQLFNIIGNKNPLIIYLPENDPGKITSIVQAYKNSLITAKESQKITCEIAEQYKSIYENSLDGILVTKPDGTILSANPSACKMLEMTEQEICTAGRSGIVDQEDPRLEIALSQREELGSAQSELNFIKKSGEKVPIELSSSVFKDSNGVLKTTIILRDITDRKLVENELAISYESYKTIFYQSPIPYWIYDQDTLEIIDVNEAAIQTYGYTREEFLKLNILNLQAQKDIPILNQQLPEIIQKESIIKNGKFTHLKKDGSIIRVEVFGYQLNFIKTKCRLVASIDITKKEEALELVQKKKERLAAAQEIAKIGYWEYNLLSQTYFFSDMMFKLWEIEDLNCTPSLSLISDNIHPEDRENFLQIHMDTITTGKEHEIEYRILQAKGEVKWIHERGRVLSWLNNKPEIFERIVQDITEEKNYLEKLTTSESRYKGIVQSQTNYLIRTDMHGNYTYYNDKFLADFGWLYEKKEIIGQHSFSSIMEYHHQAVIDIVNRCTKSPGKAFQIEIDKPKQKGEKRTTLWDFVCLIDNTGQPSEIQCVGVDISGRVRAERQLKDSKLRYQLITRATSDAIWDWDLKTGDLYWGKGLKSIFGYEPHNFKSITSWENIIHPEDAPGVLEKLQNTLNGKGKKWHSEFRIKKSNGDFAYVLEKGSILRDKGQKAYRFVGAMQDITERRKLQDLLEKANTLSRIGSYELDLKNGTLYWSPMTKEIHEVDKEFEPDLSTAIYFYKKGKCRNTIRKKLRDAINNFKPFDVELQIHSAKGREIWVRAIGQPEVENGICVKIKGSFQDVDKIKRAEQEVLIAAREKQIILESIGDAFFAVDHNWTVTYWNKHAVSLLNCPKGTILKKNLWDIFPDAIGTPFQFKYESTMQDRKKRHFEAFFERTSSWFEVSVYPSQEGLSIFFQDITQRKNSEVRLRELNKNLRAHTRELVTANKGLEQFSYIVSHNLRSPVANIKGLSHLLQHADYPQEIKEKFFEEIFSNVERLDNVITDLNNILQIKVDVKAKNEIIDLKKLVKEIEYSIEHIIKEEQVSIETDFEDAPSIVSVKGYLYSIFYNLILNSIKYRRPTVTPVIKICTMIKGEFIILKFRDNGLGMDLTSKKDQIFNLYKRFHHHVEGKGMGLYMVKTQIEMLGGTISLESEINKGTAFTIILKENNKPIEIDEKAMSLSGC